jgi:hypothetical protein
LPYPYFRKKSDTAEVNKIKDAITLIDKFKSENLIAPIADEYKKRNHEFFADYLSLVRYLLDALIKKFEGECEEKIAERIAELKALAYRFEESCPTDFSAYAFMSRFSEVLSKGFTKSEF